MVKWCRSVLPERWWGGVRRVKGESGKKRGDAGLESSDHKPTSQSASPAPGLSHRQEDPTRPATRDGQGNLITGQWVLLEGGLWGTSTRLIFIKRTWMGPSLLCLWAHLWEQRPRLTFTISVSPQILLAGGRVDCVANRACSPTTTWPRSEVRGDADAREERASGTRGRGRVGALLPIHSKQLLLWGLEALGPLPVEDFAELGWRQGVSLHRIPGGQNKHPLRFIYSI